MLRGLLDVKRVADDELKVFFILLTLVKMYKTNLLRGTTGTYRNFQKAYRNNLPCCFTWYFKTFKLDIRKVTGFFSPNFTLIM